MIRSHIISKIAAAFVAALFMSASFHCLHARIPAEPDASLLPATVYVGGQIQHVQGIAYDSERNCMYMSFTSRFLKVDMQGNILASIDRIQGHLGAMTFNQSDRKVYASLECKDDEIGQGIARTLDVKTVSRSDSRFYIAIIDVDALEGIGMDPENNPVLKTVCIRKAVDDYSFKGKGYEHRYGCSGIDGVAIAPAVGPAKAALYGGRVQEKLYLYVGYGIYGDLDRKDNDYQVIQRYDIDELNTLAKTVVFGQTHSSGPDKAEEEYFVNTGNTVYGVQNMAYDSFTDCLYLAVYKGKKPEFPNYTLFAIPLVQKPFKAALKGGRDSKRRLQLSLVRPEEPYFINPMLDDATGISGWRFKWGSTGLCPLGKGLWYISENHRDRSTKEESCTARLYRWTGNPDGPFVPVGQ